MTFQIHALPAAPFAPLFALADNELAQVGARKMTVDEQPGFPCRVSLADAEVGETVILVNYEHQPGDTPYRSSHAIFIREKAVQARPEPGKVPASLTSRLISVRAFDSEHMMVSADVVDGRELDAAIRTMLVDSHVAYLHLHNAKPGCFAASVTRE
jgi:hypothetical protein